MNSEFNVFDYIKYLKSENKTREKREVPFFDEETTNSFHDYLIELDSRILQAEVDVIKQENLFVKFALSDDFNYQVQEQKCLSLWNKIQEKQTLYNILNNFYKWNF